MIAGKPEPTVLDDAWALVNEPTAEVPSDDVPREPPPPPDVDHTVGVVFVHGIGSQVAGETIFDWSAPLVRTLWAWAEATADPENGRPFTDPVEWADVDLTGQSTPVLQVVIPEMDGHQRQRWVMTEAWWAADVRPPSLSTMLDWLVGKGEVKHIGGGIINGLRITAARRREDITAPDPASPPVIQGRGFVDFLDKIALGLLFGLLALVIVPIYSILRVLGSLPIPGLKGAVSTTQIDLFLMNWFGDVRILLADRAQAANLRTQMATAILKLRAYGADSIVVVAHSGGTVLSYMLLADPYYDDLDIDKFITHGQALGLAWTLGHLKDEVRPDYDDGLRDGDRLMRVAHHARQDGTASKLRWVDFHASHDPAPAFTASGWPRDIPGTAGQPGPGDKPDQSWTVFNRMSVRNDHGGYWDNEEQFIIPLLRELDTPGRTHLASRFYPDREADRARVERRASRVRGLARWWNTWMALLGAAIVLSLLVTALTGAGLVDLGTHIANVLRSIPLLGFAAGIWPFLLGLIGMVVLFALHANGAVGAWDKLDVAERREARRAAPAAVARDVVRGRFFLYLVACVAVIPLAVVPHPVTAIIALATGVLAHWPDALAKALSPLGGKFDPPAGAAGPPPPAVEVDPPDPVEDPGA